MDALPGPGVHAAIVLAAAVALLGTVALPTPWARFGALPALLALSCCWSLWVFQERLEDRLPAERSGERIAVNGRLASIPQEYDEYVSFLFEPLTQAPQRLPGRLLLRWYRDWPPLAAGSPW